MPYGAFFLERRPGFMSHSFCRAPGPWLACPVQQILFQCYTTACVAKELPRAPPLRRVTHCWEIIPTYKAKHFRGKTKVTACVAKEFLRVPLLKRVTHCWNTIRTYKTDIFGAELGCDSRRKMVYPSSPPRREEKKRVKKTLRRPDAGAQETPPWC